VAYDANGKARSGMGLDSADFNDDGWMDLFVANLDREMFAIYQNNHDGTFDDLAIPTGIGKITKFMSGWGLKFFDYDNDGNLDLFLANGNPDDLVNSLHGEVMSAPPAARSSPEGLTRVAWPSAISITMAPSMS
jgi:enediyne biosynthesis protein E4